MKTVACVITVG